MLSIQEQCSWIFLSVQQFELGLSDAQSKQFSQLSEKCMVKSMKHKARNIHATQNSNCIWGLGVRLNGQNNISALDNCTSRKKCCILSSIF